MFENDAHHPYFHILFSLYPYFQEHGYTEVINTNYVTSIICILQKIFLPIFWLKLITKIQSKISSQKDSTKWNQTEKNVYPRKYLQNLKKKNKKSLHLWRKGKLQWKLAITWRIWRRTGKFASNHINNIKAHNYACLHHLFLNIWSSTNKSHYETNTVSTVWIGFTELKFILKS